MADFVAVGVLNAAADFLVNRSLDVRLHNAADPGNTAANGRIGAIQQSIAAAGWTDAANGVVSNEAAVNFGVLSTGAQNIVRAYSVWDGNTFLWWGNVVQAGTSTIGVTVEANESFSINANEISLTVSM